MILDMQGGFLTKERGGVDVKVCPEIQTLSIPLVREGRFTIYNSEIKITYISGKRFDANVLVIGGNSQRKSP